MSVLPRGFFDRLWTKPFFIFSCIMIFKIYLTWFVLFNESSPWKPLVTDIISVWLLFCLIEYFTARRKLLLYMIVNLLLTTVFFAAIMYYKYYGVIVTYHALRQVNQVGEVKDSVFSLIDPQYMLIFIDIIVLSIWFFAGKSMKHWRKRIAGKASRKVVAAAFLVLLTFCFANIWPHRASMNELTQASNMGLLNYEAYMILGDKKEEPEPMQAITAEAIRELKGNAVVDDPQMWGAAEGRNLIIIQMEAFQRLLLGLELDGKEVTPVMNALLGESLFFPHFYQQVGQGNTSDAEYVVNTSFYIPPRGAASQIYGGKALPSLPKLLQESGYFTGTFHTNDVKFWSRNELYQAIGFDRYYDKEFFGSDDIVSFGPSDEVLYRRTAEELGRLQAEGKPFYSHVIAMTAHHPFKLPEDKISIELPDEYHNTFLGDYLTAQHYADKALGQFIDALKQNGVWDNSLIMIYGDHLGLPMYSLDPTDKKLLEQILGREYSYSDMLNIPLVATIPGVTEQVVMPHTGGQIDIFPTAANLLGLSMQDRIFFGQDLLNHTSNLLPQRYYLPSGSLITDQAVFVPGSGYEDGEVYSLGDSEPVDGDVTVDEYERALQLLKFSDSYIDQLEAHN
ncbi:LTA synthase family protein [Paenibacillaceae bacterium]|nr:LTA synthase family protein [Paenibacillaceae bacterium]